MYHQSIQILFEILIDLIALKHEIMTRPCDVWNYITRLGSLPNFVDSIAWGVGSQENLKILLILIL